MDLTITHRSELPMGTEPNQVNHVLSIDENSVRVGSSVKQLGPCPQSRAAKSVFSIRSIVDDSEERSCSTHVTG